MKRPLARLIVFSCLLLLPFIAHAQGTWRAYDFFNLVGGLNDAFDPTAIALNEASDLQNVVFATGGAISKRSGYTRLNSSTACGGGTATGVFMYKQADGDRFLLAVCPTNDTIVKMDYGGGTSGPDGTWDDITGTLAFNVGNDHQADFAVAQDRVIIEDGLNTTAPYSWTGTGNAVALGGGSPNATMVEYHKRHMFAAGDSANPSTLSVANLDDITTWTSTDTLAIETNDGQIIRGLKSALDCLYIFKDASIWRTCGTDRDNFTVEQMVRGIGTCSNNSLAVINNQFTFMTCQGDIVLYDGGLTIQFISTKIEGTIGNLNRDRFDNAVAVAFDDGTGDEDYYLAVSTAGVATHNRLLVFDTFHRAWTKFVGINANALGVYEIGTLQHALAFFDYGGFANRYPNTDADAGAAINAFWQSGQLRFDIPWQKIMRLAHVFVNQEGNWNLTFEYRIDFEGIGTVSSVSLSGSGSVWDTAVYSSSTYADLTTTIGRVEMFRPAEFFQWRISNANATEPFTVKGVRLWLEPTERTGGVF